MTFFPDRTCFVQNTYNSFDTGTCDSCSSVCVGGCTGAGTFAGDGGCSLCNVIEVDNDINQVATLLPHCCLIMIITIPFAG